MPDQVAPVVTSMNGPNVKIEWTIPDNGASALTKFQILIQKSDGTFMEDLTFCDGSNLVILANAFCQIPMQILTASPYSLT